jgi:hypothetical protein
MENADSRAMGTTDATPPDHSMVVGRALASAALFGWLGSRLGKWLGKRGNDDAGKMAEPIMKWSMGIFWAVLAAYSSLKASDREWSQQTARDKEASKNGEKDMIIEHDVMHEPSKNPPAVVQADTAENLGLMQDSPQHQRS